MLQSICGRHIGNYSETEKAISGFAFNPCTGLQLSRQQVLIIEEVHVGSHWGQEGRQGELVCKYEGSFRITFYMYDSLTKELVSQNFVKESVPKE